VDHGYETRVASSDAEARAVAHERLRPELTGYLTRLVARGDVAEELVQTAALRLLEADTVPPDAAGLRAWLFRVATNLAIDHLRRHATWRESVLLDTRARAEADPSFVAESHLLRGSPEMKQVAREHLVVCFACTLRNVGPRSAAALLLREVYGFTVSETAALLEARESQVKGWIQEARATLAARYAETCALVAQRGPCHQCVELDGFFGADRGDPLAATGRDLDARLAVLRERATDGLGPWHRRMMALVDEVLEGRGGS
jgi:RNA polymerase sigma-70 factor (ECF subfamily)